MHSRLQTDIRYHITVNTDRYTGQNPPPTKSHARQRHPRRCNAHRRDWHTRRAARDYYRTAQPAFTPNTHDANCLLQLACTAHCATHAHFPILSTTSVS